MLQSCRGPARPGGDPAVEAERGQDQEGGDRQRRHPRIGRDRQMPGQADGGEGDDGHQPARQPLAAPAQDDDPRECEGQQGDVWHPVESQVLRGVVLEAERNPEEDALAIVDQVAQVDAGMVLRCCRSPRCVSSRLAWSWGIATTRRKRARCGARLGSVKTASAFCQLPVSPGLGLLIQYSDSPEAAVQ